MSASRYRTLAGAEAEFQPGSRGRVLKNQLSIRTKRDMDRAEFRALVVAQTRWLSLVTPRTRFTAPRLCAMHRDWLGSIYAWAGRYRTVELQKGDFRWPPAWRVPDNMATFEKGLLGRDTPCRPGPLREVARRIAEVHAELLPIHPFREGNGRLARWLAGLMALQAGMPSPEYRFAGRGGKAERARYLDAVKRGYVTDYAALTDFFAEAIARRL